MGITVVLLAYKEEENLRMLLPVINKNMIHLAIDYEILVVDTNEPLDNTKAVCTEYGARYINQELHGFGGAFKTAIDYASKDIFLILDSDGSHNPKYIKDIYDKFINESHDVVIGSRYIDGGETNDTIASIIMSKILNFFFRLFLGIKAKDISTDYRIYHTEQLKKVTLTKTNYDVLQEVLLKLRLNKPNLSIGEVPICFEKRVHGESKRKLFSFIIDYAKSLFSLTFLRFPVLKNLILYVLIGLIGAMLEYLVFLLMIARIAIPESANIIGMLIGFTVTFTLNTFINFKKADKLFKRFLTYGIICLTGIGISTLCINLLKDIINIYLLKLILMSSVSLLQFFLNRTITYKK